MTTCSVQTHRHGLNDHSHNSTQTGAASGHSQHEVTTTVLGKQLPTQASKSSTEETDAYSTRGAEMYVATNVQPGRKSSTVRKLVPPPRGNGTAVQQLSPGLKQQPPQAAEVGLNGKPDAASVSQQQAAAHRRAAKAELASLATQLQTKNSQLSKADAAIR